MKLYYFKDRAGNFGDDLNPWLWRQCFQNVFRKESDTIFLGVGTILNDSLPPYKNVVVFGSGYGYGKKPKITDNWDIFAVRGPHTAKALGLSRKKAITDPAILASRFFDSNVPKRYKYSFIPHHKSSKHADWKCVCDNVGINYVDPKGNYLDVMRQIAESEIVLTEAMHGAILADSFRVPWIPIKMYDHIFELKWRDWTRSMSLPYVPERIQGLWDVPDENFNYVKYIAKKSLQQIGVWSHRWAQPSKVAKQASGQTEYSKAASQLDFIARNSRCFLSEDALYEQKLDKYNEIIELFKMKYLS